MPPSWITCLLATLASAALYALSFPPVDLAPLAWIALVPFLVVVSALRPRVAAGWGFLLGLAGTYGLGWWFPDMLASYFERSLAIGWLGFLAVASLSVASYYAAFAAWVAWLAARGAAGALVIAAGWGALEFARSTLPVGNPMGLVAYSQVRWPQLMQIADVTGPYGLGMLVLATNACLASLITPRLRAARPALSFAAVGLALLATLAYGNWRLGQLLATGAPVTVAIVQDAVGRDVRRRPEVRAARLGRYLGLTEDAASTRPATVFWPENAIDFHLQDPSADRDRILGLTRRLGSDLILGGPGYTLGEAGPRRHNSVFLVRDGHLAGRYDKHLLLPLAERGPGLALEPGRRVSALRAGAGLVGTFVCFEAMYPALVRRLAAGGAEVLANLSNDAWFGHAAPAQHLLDIASVRAIENRRYLVRSTTTGFSAVFDAHGRAVGRTQLDSVEVLTTQIRRSRHPTPYQRLGDAAAWAMIAVALAASFHRRASHGTTRKGGMS